MSKFTLPANGNTSAVWFTVPNDDRGAPPQYQSVPEQAGTFTATAPFADAVLWPRTRYCGPEMSCGILSEDATATGRWAPPPQEGGCQSQLKIVGVTKDGNGNPLGSCLIRGYLINTSDVSEVFIAEVTSDSGGYFEFISQYPSQNHFLVAYKAGSPDFIGSSVRTLVPS